MTLPYHYARCTTQHCPLAARCARKDDGRTDGGPQPTAAYGGGEGCHGFIERDET